MAKHIEFSRLIQIIIKNVEFLLCVQTYFVSNSYVITYSIKKSKWEALFDRLDSWTWSIFSKAILLPSMFRGCFWHRQLSGSTEIATLGV